MAGQTNLTAGFGYFQKWLVIGIVADEIVVYIVTGTALYSAIRQQQLCDGSSADIRTTSSNGDSSDRRVI